MWQRIKTAIVLVIIVGIAMFASQTPVLFAPLLAIGVVIAAHEWAKLMPKWRQPIVFVLLVFVITVLSLMFKVTWLFWWIASLVIWLMALSWVKVFPTQTKWYGKQLALMGVVILTASITAMFYLCSYPPGGSFTCSYWYGALTVVLTSLAVSLVAERWHPMSHPIKVWRA
mgnify:CR=1 FL=1